VEEAAHNDSKQDHCNWAQESWRNVQHSNVVNGTMLGHTMLT
jgi:hypothetical protein